MTLLLCDDEVLTTRALAAAVDWTACGIDRVIEANSAVQAREVFAAQAVDLMLCDIEMPGESGFKLLEWVRLNFPQVICSMLTCHADFDYARQAIHLQSFEYILKPVDENMLADVARRMVSESKGRREAVEIGLYGRLWLKDRVEKAAEDKEDITERVREYILNHIDREISIEKLARLVFLSPDHLSRLYKKKTGETLNHYIIERRMALAANLLKNGLPALETAERVGYASYSSFVNMFKRVYGMSPAAYQGHEE
jgi:YesN/AraC family two-component response regulator